MDQLFTLLLCVGVFSILTQAKFKTLNCQSYDLSAGNFSKCAIKAISRTRNYINIRFDLYKNAGNCLNVQIQFLKRANGWRPFLYNFKINVCQFFRKPHHMIGILAFAYLKPYTNLNHTCPYVAGSSIIVTNFELDVDRLRSRFPIDNGEYALNMSIYCGNALRASINGSIYHFDYKDQ